MQENSIVGRSDGYVDLKKKTETWQLNGYNVFAAFLSQRWRLHFA